MKIEVNPLVFLDGQRQYEGVHYSFTKHKDSSIEFYFFQRRGLRLKVSRSSLVLLNGEVTTFVSLNGRQIPAGECAIVSYDKGKGFVIFFKSELIKRIDLIPQFEEENVIKSRELKEKKRKYEKEHPDVVKYWE